MKLVLICAMDEEANGFRSMLEQRKDRTLSGLTFSDGRWLGHDVTVVRCGVGKVNAALCAQTVALTCTPDLVIHVGVAGGVGDGVTTGHVVVADDTVQYDFDLSLLGEEEGKIAPCHPVFSEKMYAAALSVVGDCAHFGRIATGDRFVADGAFSARLRDHFLALACEMEGGATAQVCQNAGIPCVILRAISDNANEHSSVDFPAFLSAAVKDTEAIIASFLQKCEAKQ